MSSPKRNVFLVDLLSQERRAAYDQAARRNGLKLSAWLREVADAASERSPLPAPPADLVPVADPEPVVAVPHEHVLKRTPWGGRVCEGCGDLL